MRLAARLAIVAVATALLPGCGSSGDGSTETGSTAAPNSNAPTAPAGAAVHSCDSGAAGPESLRATGVSCEQARQLLLEWQRETACAPPGGASRSACTTDSYRCLAISTARGVAVDCSRPGRSVAFLVRRG